MTLYKLERNVYDTMNDHDLRRGDFVDCSDTAWVNRMGSALAKVSSVPKRAKVTTVEDTVEAKKEKGASIHAESAKAKEEADAVNKATRNRAGK